MPLRQYFAWTGSILLVALFAADWCFPVPLPARHPEIPPHERVNLRIRSDHKWPEKVVLDTTRSTPIADAARERDVMSSQNTAGARWRIPLDAFAAMLPAALPSTDRQASEVGFQAILPSKLPQSGRMTLGFAVSLQIPEGSTSAAAEISGAEHEGHFVSRCVRRQSAVLRSICAHPEAPGHQSGRGDDQAASLRTGACASAADAEILLTASP
jgi:hypothetical protein